jgi:hypothetical protein
VATGVPFTTSVENGLPQRGGLTFTTRRSEYGFFCAMIDGLALLLVGFVVCSPSAGSQTMKVLLFLQAEKCVAVFTDAVAVYGQLSESTCARHALYVRLAAL